MEQHQHQGDQYFVSMTDMLLGLLIIFLVIVGYLAVSFSQSLDRARSADDAERRAQQAEARASEAIERAENAEKQIQVAKSKIAAAIIRAESEKNRADEFQSILLSIDETQIDILRKIKKRLSEFDFTVEIDEKTGVVRLPEAELFQTAKFELTQQGKRNILVLRKALEEILPCYSSSQNSTTQVESLADCNNTSKNFVDAFFVEGHADSQPVRTNNLFRDNQELSTKRAMNAYNLLFNSKILSSLTNSNDEFIMSVSGYGSNRPLCLEKSKSCYTKNRRIDLRLVMEVPTGILGNLKTKN